MIVLRLFLILSILASVRCNGSPLVSLITDFLQIQNLPTEVVPFLCWNKGQQIELYKTLSRRSIKSSYSNSFKNYFLPPHFKPEHTLFLLDIDCDDSTNILNQAQSRNLFKAPYRWLIITSNNSNLSVFNKLSLLTDSKLCIIQPTQEESYRFKYLFKYSDDSSTYIETNFALWAHPTGFLHSDHVIPARARNDLKGTLIKISYVVTKPDTLNHLWDYRYKHVDAISKLNYILVHHLIDLVNASKSSIVQPTWGYKNVTTSQYSGMIGDLQRGVADLGGTPAFFTEDRVPIIDYIAATTPTHMKFIFRAPPLSYVTNVFILPFDTMVWYACLILVLLTPVALYIISIWEWKDTEFCKTVEETHGRLRSNFLDSVMLEIGAISQQGTDVEPKSSSGRIATIFMFISLMFLYTSYSANVVALLQTTADSIKTLDDLLYSRIKLGVEDIVYAHYYFSTAQEPIRKAIYEQKIEPKGQQSNFMPVEEGIKRMRDEFFAFHVELATGYKVVGEIFKENEKCSLKEIEYVHLIEPWIATQKRSSFKEILKIGMRKIHESGIQNREVRRIYTRKPTCHSKGSNFVSVGLIDCYFPFLIFGSGIFAAFVLMLLENGIHRYCKNRKLSTGSLILRETNKFTTIKGN